MNFSIGEFVKKMAYCTTITVPVYGGVLNLPIHNPPNFGNGGRSRSPDV